MTSRQEVNPEPEVAASRQCILYYTNPNFIDDHGQTTTVQLGNEEVDEEEEEEEDDDDEDEEEDDYEEDDEDDKSRFCRPEVVVRVPEMTTDHVDDHEPEAEFYAHGITMETPATDQSADRKRQSSLSSSSSPGGGGPTKYRGCCLGGSSTSCLRTRPCLFLVYVTLVLVLLSSFVSLILVTVLVVEPYVKVIGFVNGTCRTLKVRVGREEQTCSCGKGCNSKYYCLQIEVEYFDEELTTMMSAILYEDETSLNRQCSVYPPCRSSRQDNEEAVLLYKRLYGRVGAEFGCWYNPTNPTAGAKGLMARRRSSTGPLPAPGQAPIAPIGRSGEAIQRRRYEPFHVIHGLIWPSFLFCASASFLFYTFKKKGCFR